MKLNPKTFTPGAGPRDFLVELASYTALEKNVTADKRPKRDFKVNARSFPIIVTRALAVYAAATSPRTRPNLAAGFAFRAGGELLLKVAGKDLHAISAAEDVVRGRGAHDDAVWFEAFGFVVGDMGGGKPVSQYFYLTNDEAQSLCALHEKITCRIHRAPHCPRCCSCRRYGRLTRRADGGCTGKSTGSSLRLADEPSAAVTVGLPPLPAISECNRLAAGLPMPVPCYLWAREGEYGSYLPSGCPACESCRAHRAVISAWREDAQGLDLRAFRWARFGDNKFTELRRFRLMQEWIKWNVTL